MKELQREKGLGQGHTAQEGTELEPRSYCSFSQHEAFSIIGQGSEIWAS